MKKQGTTAAKESRPAPKRASSAKKPTAVSAGKAPARPKAKTPDPGTAAMDRLASLVSDRWEKRSRDYDEAKKGFERAAKAAHKRDADDAKGSTQVKKDLNQFGMEMRLQAARRAELDWVRQVIEDPSRVRTS